MTDTDQASELFELCKEVYGRTGWADGDSSLQWWLKYFYAEGKHDLKLVRVEDEKEIGKYDVPLYTSDYLLEKLPYWVSVTKEGKYAAIPKGHQYSAQIVNEAPVIYSNTPLKALLKLTIALSEAGELK